MIESDGVEVWSAFRRLFLGSVASKERAFDLLATMKGYLRKTRDSGELIPLEVQAEMSVISENPIATRELLEAIQRFIDFTSPGPSPGSSSIPPISA